VTRSHTNACSHSPSEDPKRRSRSPREVSTPSPSAQSPPVAKGARAGHTGEPPGVLKVPIVGALIVVAAIALACLAALAVVASIKRAETLATVALALAVVTFVAQLIVFVVQAGAANQQMLQSRALHAQQLQLLGEMGERARGTEATVTRIDEHLLEAALAKSPATAGDPRAIAMEVSALLNAPLQSTTDEASASPPAPEMRDPVRNERARARLESLPTENLQAALDALENLSPMARDALRDWGRDEMNYEGTSYTTGLTMSGGPRQDVLDAGLVRASSRNQTLYILTEPGRDAAAVLLSPEEPQGPLADAVTRVRRE
jgi:hypothetical protein